MRIIFIGAATSNHTIRWVNSLAKRGHNVLLLSRKDQRDEKHCISSDVNIHYLKYGGGIGYYLNVFEVKKIVKEYKPDVVNAHYATGYGTLARLSKCKNLVISVWGSDIYEFPWIKKSNRRLVCKNLNYADAIASTSFAMAEETRRVLNNPSKKITVTPFGVDLQLFYPSLKKTRKENKIIGIVKYLEPIYDIPLLINAFEIIKRKNRNVELHIYGDGKLKDELVEMCDKKGILNSVHFMGTIPNFEVPNALRTMDVFVNCSKQESFGVAIIEAMACKIPVVATDCEGYKEIIDNDNLGIVISRRDPELLASSILYLLDNPSISAKISEKAFEKVCQQYDWEKNVSIMEQLYFDVSKNKSITGMEIL